MYHLYNAVLTSSNSDTRHSLLEWILLPEAFDSYSDDLGYLGSSTLKLFSQRYLVHLVFLKHLNHFHLFHQGQIIPLLCSGRHLSGLKDMGGANASNYSVVGTSIKSNIMASQVV